MNGDICDCLACQLSWHKRLEYHDSLDDYVQVTAFGHLPPIETLEEEVTVRV